MIQIHMRPNCLRVACIAQRSAAGLRQSREVGSFPAVTGSPEASISWESHLRGLKQQPSHTKRQRQKQPLVDLWLNAATEQKLATRSSPSRLSDSNQLSSVTAEAKVVEKELRSRYGSEIDPDKLLVELLMDSSAITMSSAAAEGLVKGFERTLRNLNSSVVDVAVPAGKKVVVVGDTHGQLQDVLHIFATQGPPSSSTVYLFNGDIVDRGEFAVEIWLLLMTFHLKYPGSIHVLRGNHEDEFLSSRCRSKGGGFKAECIAKYGPGIFDAFLDVFKSLPLFAVIGGEVFVVHGGLPRSPSVDLDTLRKLPVANWRSNVQIPSEDRTTLTDEEEIVFDALWADPHSGAGLMLSKRSKFPVWNSFGEDVTRNFLDRVGLSLCIRSHEMPKCGRGYAYTHNGRLLTVFSASHYSGRNVNKGAVAILRDALSTGRAPCAPLMGLDLELVEHCIDRH